jgi:folate-dependent phosphoribosylglycinamide formyltransferase PurN
MNSLRALFIGLAGDALSGAALEACAKAATSVDVISSASDPLPVSSATGGQSLFMNRPAFRWYGTASELAMKISASKANVLVSAGCHHILSPEVIESLKFGCFNVHPSLLPKYRGYSPIFWQYQQGDRQAGVTVHRMDSGVDTGPVVCQEGFEIPLGSPLSEVVQLYSAAAGRLVTTLMGLLVMGHVLTRPQDDPPGLLIARKPKAEDYRVEWERWPLERIWHFLRMDQMVVDRSIPLIDDTEEGKKRISSGDGEQSFRWEVGQVEWSLTSGVSGAVVEDAQGYAIHHREGKIRLRRVLRN